MKTTIERNLATLKAEGNLRVLPRDRSDSPGMTDFSSNDYLGLSAHPELQQCFLQEHAGDSHWLLGSGASRLLAGTQKIYSQLEDTISSQYDHGRQALVFNSGYHANTGIIGALSSAGVAIVADKLVHASIIDGLRLGGKPFERFRHNDMEHLERLLAKVSATGATPMIVAEIVYSMDGDSPDIATLVDLKRKYNALLYLDEAHAIGVCGPNGMGLGFEYIGDIDIIVGTFGKALASAGAYAVCTPSMKQWLINNARSLIFSTALPPLTVMWNDFIFRHMLTMNNERRHLAMLGERLGKTLGNGSSSHIQPFMVGDAAKAVELSAALARRNLIVLPIRRPTVPPGTERLRISLSAAMTVEQIDNLASELKSHGTQN